MDKHQFEEIKNSLIEQGYLTEVDNDVLFLSVQTTQFNKLNPFIRNLAVNWVSLNWKRQYGAEPSPSFEQCYFQLMYEAMSLYVDKISVQKLGKTEKEHLKTLKAFLDKNARDDNDVLFFLRFKLSRDVLDRNDRRRIWKQVVNGELSVEKANEQLKEKAYEKFLDTKDFSVKRQCLKITSELKAKDDKWITDLEEINLVCNVKDDAFDYLYYGIRGEKNPEYTDYYENLVRINSHDIRDQFPKLMNDLFEGLIKEANILYQDSKEPEKTKEACNQLMKQIVEYRQEFARIRSFQGAFGSADEDQRKAMASDIESLQMKAKDIDQKINQLSKKTTSKRWLRIILMASAIFALGVITMGYGWGVGIHMMAREMRKDFGFFNKTKEHSSIVLQARELMKEVDPSPLKLEHPEQFSKGDSEDIELRVFTEADQNLRKGSR